MKTSNLNFIDLVSIIITSKERWTRFVVVDQSRLVVVILYVESRVWVTLRIWEDETVTFRQRSIHPSSIRRRSRTIPSKAKTSFGCRQLLQQLFLERIQRWSDFIGWGKGHLVVPSSDKYWKRESRDSAQPIREKNGRSRRRYECKPQAQCV